MKPLTENSKIHLIERGDIDNDPYYVSRIKAHFINILTGEHFTEYFYANRHYPELMAIANKLTLPELNLLIEHIDRNPQK